MEIDYFSYFLWNTHLDLLQQQNQKQMFQRPFRIRDTGGLYARWSILWIRSFEPLREHEKYTQNVFNKFLLLSQNIIYSFGTFRTYLKLV